MTPSERQALNHKFCAKCGYSMREVASWHGYDRATGAPVQARYWSCPNFNWPHRSGDGDHDRTPREG